MFGGGDSDNFMVIRVIDTTYDKYTTSIGTFTYDNNYAFGDVVYVNQARSSSCPTFVVNKYGGVSEYHYSGTNTAVVGMLGTYSPNWIPLFEKAGIIDSVPDYNNILNAINDNITNLDYDIRTIYQQLSTTNQTIGNTYNFMTNETHTDETSLPINTVNVNDPYNLNSSQQQLQQVLLSDNSTDKEFTMTLPNNDAFSFKISPDLLRTSLTRIGGNGIILLIQALWYIGVYGIIIFDFKRIINQIASGDLLNITTDSSPIDNVVSASLSSSGAISTSTTHSGGDR